MNFFNKQNGFPELSLEELCEKAKSAIDFSDAVLIGAGAGLSTSAGFTYSGARFDRYFSDFRNRYGFSDMYSGGFYPYDSLEENWAYWSRYIWINRYMDAPKSVFSDLLNLVSEKEYFVLTTNVDHYFQKAGFDKARLFYTQGDYGLFQCSAGTTEACRNETHDNREAVRKMLESQGGVIESDGSLIVPPTVKMEIAGELVPKCPHCGKPMAMNLRSDGTFVEDAGWHAAANRYEDFLNAHKDGKIAFLELGVGGNTPGIIKYPFWQMTAQNPNASYICVNFGEAVAPKEIKPQSICINADIGKVIDLLLSNRL